MSHGPARLFCVNPNRECPDAGGTPALRLNRKTLKHQNTMIIVNEVSKSFGTRTLFDNVSVKFTPGNRYGLTGPNGAGKSTFMKILTGEIEPSNRGTVTRPRKVGVLKQDQ